MNDVAVAVTQPMSAAHQYVGIGLEIEDVLVGERHLGEVPAVVCMMPLGFAVVPGVEDVEELLGVHRLGGAVGRGVGHEVVHHHGRRPSRAGLAVVDDDDVFDGRCADIKAASLGLRADGSPRRQPASAVMTSLASASATIGDGIGQPPQIAVGSLMRVQASIASGARAPSACRWRLGRLFGQALEHVGELLHFGEQFGVGHRDRVAGLTSQWNATLSPLPASTCRSDSCTKG